MFKNFYSNKPHSFVVIPAKAGIQKTPNVLNTKSYKLNKKGMTLLEVIIALSLFAVVAVSLMKMTDTVLKYRKTITEKSKEIKLNRNFIQILKKDLKNIFLIEDLNSKMHIAFIEKKQNPNSVPRAPETEGSQPGTGNTRGARDPETTDTTEYEQTQIYPYLSNQIQITGGFYGTENSLKVSTFSNTRLWSDDKTGEHNEVAYYIKTCQEKKNEKNSSECLWRSSSSVVDDNPEELDVQEELVLLERVKKFQISYFNMFKDEWSNEWKTDQTENKNLPAIIKLNIEYENEKSKLIKHNIMIPIYQEYLSLMIIQ